MINGTAPAVGTTLRTDPNIMYVDSDNNNLWEPGEAVVYDRNSDGMYETGEPVIAKAVPAVGASVGTDPKILFVNATTSSTETWSPGKAVVYDSDGNGKYDSLEPVIAGTPPAFGTSLKSDPKILFVNATTSSTETWSPGKAVVYDSDGNGRYDSGEPVIVGTTPTGGASLKVTPSGPAKGIRFYSWFFGSNDGTSLIFPGSVTKHIFGGELEPKVGIFWVRLRAVDFEGEEALKIEEVLVTVPMAHDLRISDFSVNPLAVAPGQDVTVRVQVEDVGTFAETFNVTLKLKDNLLNLWQNQSLGVRGTKTFEFVIKTANLSPGVYPVAAEVVMPVPDDTPGDNLARKFLELNVQQASVLPFLLGTFGVLVAGSSGIFIAKRLGSRRARPEPE